MKSLAQDTEWPRLELDYQFLTNSVADRRYKIQFSRPVILKLLELFDSEDDRERGAVATLLNGIYNRFPEQDFQSIEFLSGNQSTTYSISSVVLRIRNTMGLRSC